MGVKDLWTVVAPTARPTQLASLNRKRLAVDASIWIYQFLKAVRDKEGNALRNSHVVGFFRRICKLLYFGIKPVFVFDGGAPVLKRETVRSRARRREGRREDAARTAGKLLAVQVARAAEEEDKRRKAERERTPVEEELPPEQELVYVDELGMSQNERQAGRGFKRKDQYHLPNLDVSLESLGAPNDPRIMSQAELEEYAKQFHSGEDINLYDFSKIDFESPFFLSLPAGDRYNILNAARLRSRLRMGYSKEQLDGMFPDRMAFSKFQIERVKERNQLTQRLMHINGMGDDWSQGGRIAGEKGKEYVLVKNDGVEGGWALGVVSNKEGSKKENAIDLDEEDRIEEDVPPSEDDDDEFEDVAIEGLNRIPKVWQKKRREDDRDMSYEDAAAQIARKRKAVYDARRAAPEAQPERFAPRRPADDQDDALFVPEHDSGEGPDDLFEDVDLEAPDGEEEDDLQRAIALSLQQPEVDARASGGFLMDDNTEADAAQDEQIDADDELDLQAALAESRKSMYQSRTAVRRSSPPPPVPAKSFDGPLPFESLSLGQSLLGKKKSKKIEEGLSGGFDRNLGEDTFRKEKPVQPMPDWFEAAPTTNDLRQHMEEEPDYDEDEKAPFRRKGGNKRGALQRQPTGDVIDVDAEEEDKTSESNPIVTLSDEDIELQEHEHDDNTWDVQDEPDVPPDPKAEAEKRLQDMAREERYRLAEEIAAENDEKDTYVTRNVPDDTPAGLHTGEARLMEDVADHAQASPPPPTAIPVSIPTPKPPAMASGVRRDKDDFESVDWSDSEVEETTDIAADQLLSVDQPAGGNLQLSAADTMLSHAEGSPESDSETFEDVDMGRPQPPSLIHQSSTREFEQATAAGFLLPEEDNDGPESTAQMGNGEANTEDFGYLSDSDEELMRQLAVEAEEHARFASSLNNARTSAQAARDYEQELKQLRNQQKKDRRDADEVTQVMVQECQALLRLFGLPYITAPMEAEAQCAELVQLGLVDGIVTDDSDIFLFGGTRIYKNMFNAAKLVECYLAADLVKEFTLDRKKLIRFAHLLGSDYTEGIPGIGPVSALEILTEFETLEEFKEWCSKVQLGRPEDLESQLTTPFRRKFRNTAQKRVFLPPSFPDLRVDRAYLHPDVDSTPEEFQWGVPDLDKLRSFLMATIGWSQERTDEILVPVVRDMNKRETEGTQANITKFFAGGVGIGAAQEGTAPRNRSGRESGRMAKAFSRLRGEAERRRRGEDGEEDVPGSNASNDGAEPGIGKTATRVQKKSAKQTKRAPPIASADSEIDLDAEDESYTAKSKRKKRKA